jgi:Na+/H+ antiporter NhaC
MRELKVLTGMAALLAVGLAAAAWRRPYADNQRNWMVLGAVAFGAVFVVSLYFLALLEARRRAR